MSIYWNGAHNLTSRSYSCGYCGNQLASNQGYQGSAQSNLPPEWFIHICHFCWQPTYFPKNGGQYPGSPFGVKVKYIPSKEVEGLYEEARNCVTVNAFTAAAHCCRKLLMNIAVTKGAKEGLS